MRRAPTPAERRRIYLQSVGRSDIYEREIREPAKPRCAPAPRKNTGKPRRIPDTLTDFEKKLTLQALARPTPDQRWDREQEERISASEARYERMMVMRAMNRAGVTG